MAERGPKASNAMVQPHVIMSQTGGSQRVALVEAMMMFLTRFALLYMRVSRRKIDALSPLLA
ncbi:hypothetical protein [Ahrensia sp. R2A130]|uniref:hypothetical protein n=1 Tax=Ahrensia sp. R2A130 TaxID=744979 RepID=UPI0002F61DE6|nr:hypothetical protein [Ahrensia sp. R2A130]